MVRRANAHIMPIRALNFQTNRYSMPLRQQTAFDAGLTPISGIGPGFFAERQTSLEQPSFERRQISGRIFAEPPLLSATVLPLL